MESIRYRCNYGFEDRAKAEADAWEKDNETPRKGIEWRGYRIF